jgi:uncharacterized protein (DUF697 family)
VSLGGQVAIPYEVTPAIYELELRNKAAEAVITTFATEHALVDIAGGLIGGLVPGGSIAALIAQLTYSAVRIYPQMIKKLAVIYGAEPDDFTSRVVRNALIVESGIDSLVAAVGPEVMGQLAVDLTSEFGSEFMQEIVGEIIGESTIAAGASFIPIAGAIFGAALDAIVGATLTWRVGAVVSAYFQHGGYIGSRKKTYEAIKPHVARSAKTSRPGTLDSLRKKVSPIREKQLKFARHHFKSLKRPKKEIRAMLVDELGVPADVVDEAYKEAA